MISQITLRDRTIAGGTLEVIDTRDLRGSVPTSAGGGVSPQTTEFSDSEFRIDNATDPTKQMAFDASAITTGNIRTLTIPDKDGTIATISDLPDEVDADDVQAIAMSLNA